MSREILRRTELMEATLHLGGAPIALADYATTGLRIVAVAPSGSGKTNAGFLIAEQLSRQGWVSVLIDPEGEAEALYGEAVADPEELRERLTLRDRPFVVVSAQDATDFLPYGRAIMDAAEMHRKPLFVMCDEGQVFSAGRKRKGDIGEATDLVNDFVERGRKRALDVFLTAHRFSGSLHRSIFANANLKLIGAQADPTAWSALAAQFRASGIAFSDLAALATGEFFAFSHRGVEKTRMPMAEALRKVAPKARVLQPALPATYPQWDRAMRALPTERLHALTDPVIALLSTVAGLTAQQIRSGRRALTDEIEARP